MAVSKHIQSFIREILPNALWDGIKLVSSLAAGALVSTGIYAAFAKYIRDISPDFVVIFGIFVLSFLLLLISFLIGRYQRRKISPGTVTSSPSTTQSAMAEQLLEEKAESKCPYEWLHKLADEQVTNIQEYVLLERVALGDIELTDPIPTVRFGLYIRNESVFDISIQNEIGGHIVFKGQRLGGQIFLLYNGLEDVSYRKKGSLTIEQRLSREEAEFISKSKNDADTNFYLDGLIVTVKGSQHFSQIQPQRLIIRKGTNINGGPLAFRLN